MWVEHQVVYKQWFQLGLHAHIATELMYVAHGQSCSGKGKTLEGT